MLEQAIRQLTEPLNGQYPRPWMTTLPDPSKAKVFIVGMNQATIYPEREVKHKDYLDALFNRNGQSNRQLYDKFRDGAPSDARENIDDFTARLNSAGVTSVLETNVICYSTPKSSELSSQAHREGRKRGREIFRKLLQLITPSVLVVHGVGATKELEKAICCALPTPPKLPVKISRTVTPKKLIVYVVPSLARPEYGKWFSHAPGYLDKVAIAVAKELHKEAGPRGA